MKRGQSKFIIRPHQRGTQMVQLYSPDGVNVHPNLIHPNLHPRREGSAPAVSLGEYRAHLGVSFSPSKLPLPVRGSGPPSNTRFLGTTEVGIRNGISIRFVVFARLTVVFTRYRHTDRQTASLFTVALNETDSSSRRCCR